MKNLGFRLKIFIVMALLLVVSDIIKISFIANTNRERGVEIAKDNIFVASSVFNSFIDSWIYNNTRLTEAVLKDFAIREALSRDDHATKASVINNVQQRLEMDWALFLDQDGLIDTDPQKILQNIDRSKLQFLASKADEADNFTDTVFMIINDQLYLILVSAIDPPYPRTIGYLVLGVELDNSFLQNLVAQMPKGIKASTVVWSEATDEPKVKISNSLLSKVEQNDLLAGISSLLNTSDPQISKLDNMENITGFLKISLQNEKQKAQIFFHESLSESVKQAERLTTSLIILFLASLILVMIIAMALSKALARPILDLTKSIRGIRDGSYKTLPETDRKDEFGVLTNAFVKMIDTIKEREEKLAFLARYDVVSKLPNRYEFIKLVQSALVNEQWNTASVIIIKLQSLSQIRQTFGQDFTNRFIKKVAERIQNLSDRSVCIGHTRDNSFALLCFNEFKDKDSDIITYIAELFKKAIDIESDAIDMKESIGYATTNHASTSNDDIDAEELLRSAEAAVYRAVSTHEYSAVFDSKLDTPQTELLSLMSEMYKGIERGDFQLFLQPKVDIHNDRVVQAEALIRWFHPTRGFIGPDVFIPLAEQTGRISTLSAWIIDEAIRHVQKLKENNIDIKVGINLSVKDVTDKDLPNRLLQKLKDAGLETKDLLLEITESGVIEDPETTLSVLNHLREIGLELAIDDFGTGQASLGYVKDLPVNELKIDQSFIFNLSTDKKDQAIVKATISLAHSLGLQVTAEGVEDKKALNILKKLKCDIVQGYFFAKPSNINEFITFVNEFHSKKGAKKKS